MDAQHLPSVIGLCAHCHLPVYWGSPVAKPCEGKLVCELAHVACAVDAHRPVQ